jgi:hypothetical protein
MQAQFEKFKLKKQFEVWYRVLIRESMDLPPEVDDDVKLTPIDAETNRIELEVHSNRYLRMDKLNQLLQGKLLNHNVNLYKVKFPDPLNPRGEHITITADTEPPGGF